jgi:multiple antibiotic resistance protein
MSVGAITAQVVTLFVVLDPIGSIPIFLHATLRLSERDQRKVALLAPAVALGVLLLFLYFAQYALEEMHISIPAFQIGGALILFLFALQMIFSGQHGDSEIEPTRTAAEVAIFPVAMPGIASPGALLAVVLLTDNNRYSLIDQTITAILAVLVVACVLLALLLARQAQRLLGRAGIMVVTQIMGLVLAAFAVQQVLDGVATVLIHGTH